MKKQKRKYQHYSRAFKLAIVQEYYSTNISKNALSKKYGIKGHESILKWIRIFEAKESNPKTIKGEKIVTKSPPLNKIPDIAYLISNNPNRTMQQENKELREVIEENILETKSVQEREALKDERIEELKASLQKVEALLKEEKFKAIAYSKLIDIAEKEFKIPIRKK